MIKILFLLLIICTACSGTKKAHQINSYISFDSPTSIPLKNDGLSRLKITYTGSGGFLIKDDSSAILIDPYLSNIHPLFFLLLKKTKTDTAIINNFFKQQFGSHKDNDGIIKAILVAHSHYDHLADVPSIYLNNCNQDSTEIIGSITTKHILSSTEIGENVIPITSSNKKILKSKESENYNWIYTQNKQVRILPIPAEHAPHFMGMKFISSKKLHKNLSKYPQKVRKFPEGENYNFLIDLLDDNGKIKVRIFSHAGAACNAGIGTPNANLLAQKEVDVLLLCVANFNQVKDYPEEVISRLQPKFIIGNHWENFFRPYSKNIQKPATVPATNVKKFIARVNQKLDSLRLKNTTIFTLPIPGTTLTFAY